MADMLRVHYNFTPEKSVLEGTVIDEVLEQIPRETDICKVNYMFLSDLIDLYLKT